MNEYEKLLSKMEFEIKTTLMDINADKLEGSGVTTVSPEHKIKAARRTYVDLMVFMMRLKAELWGVYNEEKNTDRHISGN